MKKGAGCGDGVLEKEARAREEEMGRRKRRIGRRVMCLVSAYRNGIRNGYALVMVPGS